LDRGPLLGRLGIFVVAEQGHRGGGGGRDHHERGKTLHDGQCKWIAAVTKKGLVLA
jgi:hypothetical protein